MTVTRRCHDSISYDCPSGEITRAGSASPRRSSLFSPDPALEDDEEGDVTGRQQQ
jgi:hypothetical protein